MMSNKYVVCDSRISEKCKKSLEKYGYKLILVPLVSFLPVPVCAHPDMLMTEIFGEWVIDSSVNNLFAVIKNKIIYNREETGKENNVVLQYPQDVSLNCVNIGNKLICNTKTVCRQILDIAQNKNLTIIPVNQGYTKCSVVKVNDNSIITEDVSIAKACESFGVDVLLLRDKVVKLDGYSCGFIGGCSGLLKNNNLVFSGNIQLHPQYKSIYNFCKTRDVEVVSLSDEPLYDVGSIFVF